MLRVTLNILHFEAMAQYVFDTLEEIEAIAQHVDVSDFDFSALEKALVGNSSIGPALGQMYIMKESFDALVTLRFPLRIDDFRFIVHDDAWIALGSTFSGSARKEVVNDLSLRCGDVTSHVEYFALVRN